MQLSAAKDTETTEDAYLAVIRAKTAALFAAACEVGPILAGRSKAEIAACQGYGANLGIAFQLIDDALDYGGSSAKLGKNVGDDFREGKITLPVVLSFRRGATQEREFWRRTLEKGEVVDGDLEFALATMKKHRALEDTIERARHYGAMARDALELFAAFALETCAARRGRVHHRPSALTGGHHPAANACIPAGSAAPGRSARDSRSCQSGPRSHRVRPTCQKAQPGRPGVRRLRAGRSRRRWSGPSTPARPAGNGGRKPQLRRPASNPSRPAPRGSPSA